VKWEKADIKKVSLRQKYYCRADGVNSFMAKEVNAEAEYQQPVTRAMYYAYYKVLQSNEGPAANFITAGILWFIVFRANSNLTLIAASIPIDQFATFKRNVEEEFNGTVNSMGSSVRKI